MGKSQRTKGAVFEREVAKAFSEAYGREFKRNIGQARDGGNDIDVGSLVIECKRRATLGTVYGWLQQAIDALPAQEPEAYEPKVPVVVAREDEGEPIVILRLPDFIKIYGDAYLPVE